MRTEIHADLAVAVEKIYQPNQLVMTNLEREQESHEYGACTFKLNDLHIKFRVAHITPTKVGQFVTLWKRIGNGPIQPFDLSDPIDLFVISVRSENRFGHFVFPKAVLSQKDVVSQDGKGGKRAMRVYPPWDVTESRQARQTQQWQLNYFLEVPVQGAVDGALVKKLYLLSDTV